MNGGNWSSIGIAARKTRLSGPPKTGGGTAVTASVCAKAKANDSQNVKRFGNGSSAAVKACSIQLLYWSTLMFACCAILRYLSISAF
jgi:hypothetical protein